MQGGCRKSDPDHCRGGGELGPPRFLELFHPPMKQALRRLSSYPLTSNQAGRSLCVPNILNCTEETPSDRKHTSSCGLFKPRPAPLSVARHVLSRLISASAAAATGCELEEAARYVSY